MLGRIFFGPSRRSADPGKKALTMPGSRYPFCFVGRRLLRGFVFEVYSILCMRARLACGDGRAKELTWLNAKLAWILFCN